MPLLRLPRLRKPEKPEGGAVQDDEHREPHTLRHEMGERPGQFRPDALQLSQQDNAPQPGRLRGGGHGEGEPHDNTRVEGARIPRRVHRGRRGRHSPARAGSRGRRGRGSRGGAPALLRCDNESARQALHILVQGAPEAFVRAEAGRGRADGEACRRR